ncbi:hypothetical protein P4O66_009738 [Electrophorus voltai]|uniref:Uncharacterized protein n=1 Tax=Electrophorus voltai TaxID=2609070 RepID=A0AAD8ZCZ9_9TELE|nr:hypothetical protein P4O66_009738 [Electrophorus voltai]
MTMMMEHMLEDGVLRVGRQFRKIAVPIETTNQSYCVKICTFHLSYIIFMKHWGMVGEGRCCLGYEPSTASQVLIRLQQGSFPFVSSPGIIEARYLNIKMADLPVERVIPELPPFTNVRVDYFGPVYEKKRTQHERLCPTLSNNGINFVRAEKESTLHFE